MMYRTCIHNQAITIIQHKTTKNTVLYVCTYLMDTVYVQV